MALSNAAKKEIVSKYQKDSKDTGSSEVQIALLTANIKKLTEHMQKNIRAPGAVKNFDQWDG